MKIIPVSDRQKHFLLKELSPLTNLKLELRSQSIRLQKGFTHLMCLTEITIEPKPWQIETALKTLRDMQGSAILADEVGLGKTIEAGLIMKELLVRGLIQNILVLVPAPLVEQWKAEMLEKFGLEFYDMKDSGWEERPLIISSMPRIVRSETKKNELRERTFDLVVVDEAHCLKNHDTATYKFVYSLNRRNSILMSATPIQNDMIELFNLVNILKPGYLKSRKHFKQEYVKDRFTPKNVVKLKQLLSEVMIRHRRSNTLVELPRRRVRNLSIEFTDIERQFHNGVIDFTRDIYQKYADGMIPIGWDKKQVSQLLLQLILLLKQNCSSPQATVRTLRDNMIPKITGFADEQICRELIKLGNSIQVPSKAIELIKQIRASKEQCIVYSEYIPTLQMLKNSLQEKGVSVTLFYGGITPEEKQMALERFRQGECQVFLSSESGGQGLNLQFCHRLFNYDLPWNPMRIEQRIGRVHRFGQTHEVDIFTMPTKGSIDEYLLFILTSKVNLFELVIGELDTILSFMLTEEDNIEHRIGTIVLESKDSSEVEQKLRELGERMLQVKAEMKNTTDTSTQILNVIGVGS